MSKSYWQTEDDLTSEWHHGLRVGFAFGFAFAAFIIAVVVLVS